MAGSQSGLKSKELLGKLNKVRLKSFILTISSSGTAKLIPEPGVMGSQTFDYEGEIDEDGKACGVGIARRGGTTPYKGTFYDNVIHGISE